MLGPLISLTIGRKCIGGEKEGQEKGEIGEKEDTINNGKGSRGEMNRMDGREVKWKGRGQGLG